MLSGRTGPGSAQAHNNHLQQQQHSLTNSNSACPVSTQQQHHSLTNSSSACPVSTVAANQSVMLSAGQPALPSGIFKTGTDNAPPSQRFAGSGSYIPAQYSSIYGIYSQSPGHLTTLQPYSTFFPVFGRSGTSGHTLCHNSLMPGTVQGHCPQIESYSAMLASMGSQDQHRVTQGPERIPRVQAPGVPISQHISPFLSTHLAAAGVQYPGLQPTSHHRLSDSRSPSPGSAVTIHNPISTGTNQDLLSSHRLEKMSSMRGGSCLQGREGEVPRETRLYGNSSGLQEHKPTLSPSSYSVSGHVPKVSFDTVVKEYGGSRTSPAGSGDAYIRTSLSGKEGSLKHRILTRPSDSDMPNDFTTGSNKRGLKDEPLNKRSKLAGTGCTAVTYSIQASLSHHIDSQGPSVHHISDTHKASHHLVSNNNILDNRGTDSNHHLDNNLSEYRPQHQPSPYQHPYSDDNSTDHRPNQEYHSSSSLTPPSTSPTTVDQPSHLQYPSHFLKGSIIQLANGTLKRVEDLQTEDFVNSAEISSDLKVDSSTVVRIEEHPDNRTAMLSFSVGEHRVQVTVEATLEHPFFVFGQGWSSCSVSRTLARYGLDCQKLNVGDVCISLTHKDVNLKAAEISQQQEQQQQQEQSYVADPHTTFAITPGAENLEHQISSSLSTSSSPLPPASSPAGFSTSSTTVLPSSQKLEYTYTSILPSPSSTSTTAGKRRLSQTELPPPLSNIVLVKKESNNNNSRKRDLQRAESDLKEEELLEEADESDSISSLRKRRLSAPDENSAKDDQQRERDRHIEDREAQTS